MSLLTITNPSAKLYFEDRLLPEKTIVEAARVSYQGAFSDYMDDMNAADIRLLHRLYFDKHMSPFEQVDATFGIHAPISIARQFHRHRSFSYNETSARYRPSKPYFHDMLTLRKQSTENHQGSSAEVLVDAELTMNIYELSEQSYILYTEMLNKGIAREQARLVLQQGYYTFFIAKGNLRSWIHFLKLRLPKDAQDEIRVIAQQICDQLEKHYPHTIRMVLSEISTWG